MKKCLAILFLFLYQQSSTAQDIKRINTLDSFFAGIPLQKRFEDWALFINSHQGLGIDSFSKMGIYSSLKPSGPAHFPFPDSVAVKIFITTGIDTDSSGKVLNDTTRSAHIAGLFGNAKKAEKEAERIYSFIQSLLKPFYHAMDTQSTAFSIGFRNGMNSDFPDMTLDKGFSRISNSYYVRLFCDIRQRPDVKLGEK